MLARITENGQPFKLYFTFNLQKKSCEIYWVIKNVGDDVAAYESSDTGEARFAVRVSCAIEYEIRVGYHTTDNTAVAVEDYLEAQGTVILPPGSTEEAIAVTVVADDEEEPHETFFVELSEIGSDGCDSAEPETCPLPFDGLAVGTILTDEFCQRGLGYWKNQTDEWPVDRLVLGGIEYESAGLLELLEYGGPDAASKLARELVATKLNLAAGSPPSIPSPWGDRGGATHTR